MSASVFLISGLSKSQYTHSVIMGVTQAPWLGCGILDKPVYEEVGTTHAPQWIPDPDMPVASLSGLEGATHR